MKNLLTLSIILFIAQIGIAQNNFTDDLDGTEITYKYDGGNAYNVKMEDGNLNYRFLSGSKPEKWWGPFLYNAFKTENGEYLIGWYEDGFGDYVTLLIDFERKYLFGSGIIVKKSGTKVHFDKAIISNIQR